MRIDDYRTAGPLTALSAQQLSAVGALDADPITLCRAAQRLVVPPELAIAAGVDEARATEKNVRPAEEVLRIAFDLANEPLHSPRRIEQRTLGTCRHFAVLACAFLRARSIPARARCGFATYFQPGLHLDHWITEYWNDDRWVRVDSEVLGLGIVEHPDDLGPTDFLAGGEAWGAYRAGADPQTFGVSDTENWGVAEIAGNAIRDLAALHKVEMLPWDEWGPMRRCYDSGLTPEIEALMESIEAASTAADPNVLATLYARVPVPDSMII